MSHEHISQDCHVCAEALAQKLEKETAEVKRIYDLYCDTIYQRDRAREEVVRLKGDLEKVMGPHLDVEESAKARRYLASETRRLQEENEKSLLQIRALQKVVDAARPVSECHSCLSDGHGDKRLAVLKLAFEISDNGECPGRHTTAFGEEIYCRLGSGHDDLHEAIIAGCRYSWGGGLEGAKTRVCAHEPDPSSPGYGTKLCKLCGERFRQEDVEKRHCDCPCHPTNSQQQRCGVCNWKH